jgi:hypothetical protein
MPPTSHDFDFAVDGKDFVRLPAFIRQSLPRRRMVRRGGESGFRRIDPPLHCALKNLLPHRRVKVSHLLFAASDPLPFRLLPAGATLAGRASHPLETQAFPRRTEKCGLVVLCNRFTDAPRNDWQCFPKLPRHHTISLQCGKTDIKLRHLG